MGVFRQHRHPSKLRHAVAVLLVCLVAGSSAGCSVGRSALAHLRPGRLTSNSTCESCGASLCVQPTCNAPEAVVVSAPHDSPLPVPPAVPVADPAMATSAKTVPSQPMAQSTPDPSIPVIPPIPDSAVEFVVPRVPVAEGPEPIESNEELRRCQTQMAELHSRFSDLETTNQQSQRTLTLMLAEQHRLKLDNERLMHELELNHQQDIESLDSLSKIIEDVVTAPAETSQTPAAAASETAGAGALPAVPLPAVETSL